MKDKADLLEAFLGALYVDKDLYWCQVFANVCFFPRLQQFILNQDWNDPKSKLQQCCLTLRTMDGGEPDIPLYKIIECKGPTNTRYSWLINEMIAIQLVSTRLMFRVYTVAVYFRGGRLAKAQGHSIQQAEMNAAKLALETCGHLFPHLNYQKRIMEKSFKKQGVYTETIRETWYKETLRKRQELGLDTGTAAKEEEDDVKQEVKDEMSEISDCIPETDSMEDVLKDEDSETLPEVPEELGDNDTLEPEKEKSVVSTQEDQSHNVPKESAAKNSNKEAVRAEIREIEEKLRKKKQKKVAEAAVAAACDLEDGECVDSEEDFDDDKPSGGGDGKQVGHGSKPAPTLPTPPEDKTKRREDNRKRWNEGRRSSSSSHQERSREGGDRRSKGDRRHEGGGGERHGRHEGERGRQGRHDRERRDRDRGGYYDQYDQRQYRH